MADWADKIADEIAEQQRFGGHLLRPGIARAIREERERCAKIAEQTDPNAHDIAALIRKST